MSSTLSKVAIVNRAITKLGGATIIDLENTTSKAAITLVKIYDAIRDAMLSEQAWSFCIKRVKIARLASTPAYGYTYEFQIPSDCLRIIQVGQYYIAQSRASYITKDTSPYMLEGNKILTDLAPELEVRYCSRVEDTTQYSPTFVEAFACRLAYEACETITQSNTKKQVLMEEYKKAMFIAARVDAFQKAPQKLPSNSWELSRLI